MKKYMLVENAMNRPTRQTISAALSRIGLDDFRRPTLCFYTSELDTSYVSYGRSHFCQNIVIRWLSSFVAIPFRFQYSSLELNTVAPSVFEPNLYYLYYYGRWCLMN